VAEWAAVFERQVQYEAAYVGKFPTHEDDMAPAFMWAAERSRALGCGVTVVAPSRSHFGDIDALSRLSGAVDQQTPRTLATHRRTRPVVISCWPTERDLEQLDDAPGLKALVVVPWIESEIDVWRQARAAVDLLGGQPAPAAPVIADPVVRAAMEHVTLMVNLSTGLSHPRDKAYAVWALRVLKRNSQLIVPGEIQAWAMANGWRAEAARKLGEYAAGVIAGKGYTVGPTPWRPQIIRIWRTAAKQAPEN
jgi:hypothetical protein